MEAVIALLLGCVIAWAMISTWQRVSSWRENRRIRRATGSAGR